MATIAWIAWIGVIVGTSLLFWWLWRFAEKIEREEAEERAWITWLDEQWRINPYEASYWQNEFENKFMK